MLWSEPEANLTNNYTSTVGQLYSLERRFQREPNLNSFFQKSIDTDVEKGLVKVLDESEANGTFGKKMLFATSSSPKTNQAWQSETCL